MKGFGGIILTESLEDSVALSNEYAPEHLHLKVDNANALVPQLKNAGEILIGEHTPSSLANYGIGVNHVLPTGGFAHSYSATTVWDFLKRTSLSEVTKEGLESLKEAVTTMTDFEGFPAPRRRPAQTQALAVIARRRKPDEAIHLTVLPAQAGVWVASLTLAMMKIINCPGARNNIRGSFINRHRHPQRLRKTP
jgi:hypothetical protein